MFKNITNNINWHMDAIFKPSKDRKVKNQIISANNSVPRRGRGLLDTIRGSQSSQNARITRIPANSFLAAQRGRPQIGQNNQMLQSGSNTIRNVIKNDVFTELVYNQIIFFFVFAY